MRKIYLISGLLWVVVLFWGCKGTINQDGLVPPEEATYEELLVQGWEAFSQGNYQSALEKFAAAKSLNLNRTAAYTGMGWSYLKTDSLDKALDEFGICSSLNDPSASLHAGWAFLLNALKRYADSNTQVERTLELDDNWTFAYGPALDIGALYLLRAENYYLLGEFAQSLTAVQLLNATFLVDVRTDEGKALLAAEIERLKGVI